MFHSKSTFFLSVEKMIHVDMEVNLNNRERKFVNFTLRLTDERFGQDSHIIMNNISMLTKLNGQEA